MALGVLSFADTGRPVLGVGYIYLLWNVCDTVSALIHLPGMFLSANYRFEKKRQKKKGIGQVTSDPLKMRFTYYNEGNKQGCSRFSKWFPLLVFGVVDEQLSTCFLFYL